MVTETIERERLVPLDKGAEVTGLSARTFRRRVASDAVPVFLDGKDRRRRLVRLSDLDELIRPRPISRRVEERHQLQPA